MRMFVLSEWLDWIAPGSPAPTAMPCSAGTYARAKEWCLSVAVCLGLGVALVGCGEDESGLPVQPASNVSPQTSTPSPSSLETSRYHAPSVRVLERLIVRALPGPEGERRGVLSVGSRFKAVDLQEGPGCEEGWVSLGPDQWVCGRFLEPDPAPPEARIQPELEPGALIPGVYGDVKVDPAQLFGTLSHLKRGQVTRRLGGHTVVRKHEELELDGKMWWKIASGEYIAATDLKPYTPSDFHGLQLEHGITLPLVFVMPGNSWKAPAIADEHVVPLAAKRGVAPVLEVEPGARGRLPRYRIGPETWISSPHLRYAQRVAPPADVGPTERWIDINLSQQVLVAYEGPEPIFATLVSTGRADPTPRGIFRVYLKFAETQMGSEMGDDRPYLIESVPWVQFFQAGIALHCAFWHDGFGFPRSRGCVNLAPIDARLLWEWAEPRPPPGWHSLHGSLQQPGTLVKVWEDPDEPLYYYGYARDVARARGVKVKSAPRLSEQLEATRRKKLSAAASSNRTKAESNPPILPGPPAGDAGAGQTPAIDSRATASEDDKTRMTGSTSPSPVAPPAAPASSTPAAGAGAAPGPTPTPTL